MKPLTQVKIKLSKVRAFIHHRKNKKEKMTKIRSTFYCLLFLLYLSTCHNNICLASETNDALSLHVKAWNELLTHENLVNKYAIYANRLIFVKHPETYLKADIETIRKIREDQPIIYSRLSINKIKKLNIIKESDRYPRSAPFFPLLDRRILPPTAILIKLSESGKINLQEQMTALEKASLIYSIESQSHTKKSFILYCADSNAYILTSNNAISMLNMENKEIANIDCHPILIFNETDSWSPLVDKQPESKSLKELIDIMHLNETELPILEPQERKILKYLKKLSELNQAERRTAILFEKKLGPIIFHSNRFETDHDLMSEWQEAFNNYPVELEENIRRIHTGLSHLLMQQINIRGNTLSPITAFIASHINCDDRTAHTQQCDIDNYKKYFSWNLLWDWGFTSFSIDEALAIGGGGVCAEQSTYMAAILDLLDRDYYMIHLSGLDENGNKLDHRIIYVPAWDITFSNNKSFAGFKEPNNFKGLVYIYHDNQWVLFTDAVSAGNRSARDSQKLVSAFIKLSETKHFTDSYSCIPFDMKSDYGTCKKITKNSFTSNYHLIHMN